MRHVLRRGNLLIARAARAAPDDPVAFICECTDDSCLEAIFLSPRDFRFLTDVPSRHVVLEGHEEPGEEDVVLERPGYTIVEVASGASPARWVNAS